MRCPSFAWGADGGGGADEAAAGAASQCPPGYRVQNWFRGQVTDRPKSWPPWPPAGAAVPSPVAALPRAPTSLARKQEEWPTPHPSRGNSPVPDPHGSGPRRALGTPHTQLLAPSASGEPVPSLPSACLPLTGGEGQTRKPHVGGRCRCQRLGHSCRGEQGEGSRPPPGQLLGRTEASPRPPSPEGAQELPNTCAGRCPPAPACVAESPRQHVCRAPRQVSARVPGLPSGGPRDARGHEGTVGTEPRGSPSTASRCLPPSPPAELPRPLPHCGARPSTRHRPQVCRGADLSLRLTPRPRRGGAPGTASTGPGGGGPGTQRPSALTCPSTPRWPTPSPGARGACRAAGPP